MADESRIAVEKSFRAKARAGTINIPDIIEYFKTVIFADPKTND